MHAALRGCESRVKLGKAVAAGLASASPRSWVKLGKAVAAGLASASPRSWVKLGKAARQPLIQAEQGGGSWAGLGQNGPEGHPREKCRRTRFGVLSRY